MAPTHDPTPHDRIRNLTRLLAQTLHPTFAPDWLFAMEIYHQAHSLKMRWRDACLEAQYHRPAEAAPHDAGDFWAKLSGMLAMAKLAAIQTTVQREKWMGMTVRELRELFGRRGEEAGREGRWIAAVARRREDRLEVERADRKERKRKGEREREGGSGVGRGEKVRFEEPKKVERSGKEKVVEQREKVEKSDKEKNKKKALEEPPRTLRRSSGDVGRSKQSLVKEPTAPLQTHAVDPKLLSGPLQEPDNRSEELLAQEMLRRDERDSPEWYEQFSQTLSHRLLGGQTMIPRSPDQDTVLTSVLTADYISKRLAAASRGEGSTVRVHPGPKKKVDVVQMSSTGHPSGLPAHMKSKKATPGEWTETARNESPPAHEDSTESEDEPSPYHVSDELQEWLALVVEQTRDDVAQPEEDTAEFASQLAAGVARGRFERPELYQAWQADGRLRLSRQEDAASTGNDSEGSVELLQPSPRVLQLQEEHERAQELARERELEREREWELEYERLLVPETEHQQIPSINVEPPQFGLSINSNIQPAALVEDMELNPGRRIQTPFMERVMQDNAGIPAFAEAISRWSAPIGSLSLGTMARVEHPVRNLTPRTASSETLREEEGEGGEEGEEREDDEEGDEG
ncbi:uncharacterized protein LTR77_000421 [Saxophila tyrrhenica]|uniref:Uncharacterized protein n=1 Tax=Saxophila tyrrhenica TaxID=1690608 RepID=A0AAV9PSH2_9PEZI|nr:hypothetical protein LTR77_000421 [Saxophila tyrrhenica]